MNAFYNITSDKIHLQSDGKRLPAEQYQSARTAGFAWWPGSKQLVSKWTPQAADFIVSLGLELEENDEADNVEARVERFAAYAERSELSAESAADYLAERANTERRRKNAANAVSRGLSEAEHWQRRIEGTVRHAQRKEAPPVIARRIKGLEADARKFEREVQPVSESDRSEYNGEVSYWVGGSGRGQGSWMKADKIPAHQAWAQRWLDHTNRRLEYERALLAAAGGIVADSKPLEVGGAIRGGWQYDGWAVISKVNKATVEIMYPRSFYNRETKESEKRPGPGKVDKTAIRSVMTASEVAEGSQYVYGADLVKPKPAKAAPAAEAVQLVGELAEVAQRIHEQRTEQIERLQPAKKAAAAKQKELRVQLDAANGVQRSIEQLQELKHIPGFFPTPPAVVDRMLAAADVQPGAVVLEPSAGKGNIADAVRKAGAAVDCIESNFTLAEILRSAGHDAQCSDFLAVEPNAQYDFVLMNPPFENSQDIAHVQHAYKFLKDGGRLVAVMGEGAFYRSDTKAMQFRAWLEHSGGSSEKLPADSFRTSERPTGVQTRLVIVDKPESVEVVEAAKVGARGQLCFF